MKPIQLLCMSLLAVWWLGCSAATPPHQQEWDKAEAECEDPSEDQCVSLLCLGDTCGFYRCQDLPGEIELARLPPTRPPVAAAPGSGPRRNWGGSMQLPGEPVMVFPNWNGAPERVVPPSHQLTAGRWEKHHIFPQERQLRDWFEQQGVKIHNYTLPIPRDLHQRIHGTGGRGGEWNKAWREFMYSKPDAKSEEIYRHAGELIYRFQLLGGPIRPYYARPGT